MPNGTACNRLLKLVLLDLLRRLKTNFCFRCKTEILSVEDLSLDHKEPWLDATPDLFWNLDNIAFSHRSCNIRAARRDPARLRETVRQRWLNSTPKGKSWCMGCKDFLILDQFNTNRTRVSGVQKYCIKCRCNGIGRKNTAHLRKYQRPSTAELEAMLMKEGYRELAQRLKVSHMTVLQWAKDDGLTHIRRKKFAPVV